MGNSWSTARHSCQCGLSKGLWEWFSSDFNAGVSSAPQLWRFTAVMNTGTWNWNCNLRPQNAISCISLGGLSISGKCLSKVHFGLGDLWAVQGSRNLQVSPTHPCHSTWPDTWFVPFHCVSWAATAVSSSKSQLPFGNPWKDYFGNNPRIQNLLLERQFRDN